MMGIIKTKTTQGLYFINTNNFLWEISMNKPWNETMTVKERERKDNLISLFSNWYSDITKETRLCKDKAKQNPCPMECVEYIRGLYEDGYGLKVIAKLFNVSYTKLRSLFDVFDIEIRKGRSVVTDKLKQFRSQRVKGIKNPWSDEECRQKIHSNGIQGRYTTKNGKSIWLRSCWEYIYAKWLDDNDIDYEYELKQYVLSDGTSYRPDFFIMSDGDIKEVIEIKGFNKERSYKTSLFQREYGIKTVLIESINDFCVSYERELKQWKKLQRK